MEEKMKYRFLIIITLLLVLTSCESLKDGDSIVIEPDTPQLTTVQGYVYLYYPRNAVSETIVRCNNIECETSDDGYFLLAISSDLTSFTLTVDNPYSYQDRYISFEKEPGVANYGPVNLYVNDYDYSPDIQNVTTNEYFDENSSYNLLWNDVAYGGYEVKIYDYYGDDFSDRIYSPVTSPFTIKFPSVSSNQQARIQVKSLETGKTSSVAIYIRNL